MVPGIRRPRKSKWVPACAGMTAGKRACAVRLVRGRYRGHRAGLPAADEGQAALRVERWRQPEALDLVAALLAQVGQLLLGLHALGDDVQPQRVAHGDDGGGDRLVVRAAGEVADELLVELERVDRPALEVHQ